MSRYYGWAPYVPVATRRARARKKMDQLRKKGVAIQPVEISGRKIARTFWGQAWCDHLESFSDYANRLPRGRTYVRNGSVCHLEITEGAVKAMVSGSELYNVSVTIKKLPSGKWTSVKQRCAGQIGSLLELLQGRLSESVMAVVTDRHEGLFPLPGEIKLKCSCPDWAVMCKHVAAVLYGVGARLDEEPELLFRLRGLDHDELISTGVGAVAAATAGEARGRRRLAEEELGDVFGIEMSEEGVSVSPAPAEPRPEAGAPKRRAKRSTKKKAKQARRAASGKPSAGDGARPKSPRRATRPPAATAKAVAKLRAELGMSRKQFAKLLGVSAPTIGNWEKASGGLNLQSRTLHAWNTAAVLTREEAWERLGRSR